MSANARRFSVPFLIYFILLLGLLYMFHAELFVTAIRLYVTAEHNPRAEQLLGDYYENNAQLSDSLAKSFYVSAMKKYEAQLPTASSEQQALIKFKIGHLYLCGKGVDTNTAEAKRWLNEALKLATGSNAKSQEMLISEIKQGLIFANAGSNKKGAATIQPCRLQSESEFFKTLR
jgi:TPR repeat protein